MFVFSTDSTENLQRVFSTEDAYKGYTKLTRDLVMGNALFDYDEDGNRFEITKKEANAKVRKVLLDIYGLNEETVKSEKRRNRARAQHDFECFEIIESDVDFKINEGFANDEWFDRFVEEHNLKLGDDEEFETKKDIMLLVAEISGDHHDLTMQYLGENEKFKVHTKKHGVRIGRDIDLILLGRVDYTELVDKISEAYIYDIKEICYTAVYSAAEKLPSNTQFNITGALDKGKFDQLIEDVQVANNSDVFIMGTKMALKKLNALSDINWRSASQKEDVAHSGRLGDYEGTEMLEIPQRFVKNDTTKKLFDNNMLLIFPTTDDKFVKLLRRGEVEIVEKGENKADLADDYRSQEVQEEYGVVTVASQFFGRYLVEE